MMAVTGCPFGSGYKKAAALRHTLYYN